MLWTFLLDPPAWTLGVELTFYLIAPFILRGRALKYLLAIIVVSFLIKAGLSVAKLNYDPWTYRFFPAELGFFILGSVAYKISDRLDRVTRSIPAHSWIATGIIVAIILVQRLFSSRSFFCCCRKSSRNLPAMPPIVFWASFRIRSTSCMRR